MRRTELTRATQPLLQAVGPGRAGKGQGDRLQTALPGVHGSGHLRAMLSIVVPIAAPAVATTAMLSFVAKWNEYLWPLMMLNDPDKQVLTVGLVSFAMGAESGGQWGTIGAGTLMVCLPLMLAFILFQKQFLRSFGFSGIK